MVKKNFIVALNGVICVIMLFVFAACKNETSSDYSVILENMENLVVIEATKTDGSLEDALKSLKENGELEYEGSTGDYGFYLTSVNGYIPDVQKNEYWALYSTLGEYEGVTYSDTEFGQYEYNGKICAAASYGVSGMPLVEGELYVLAVSSY
ncbi:MAG: hypothetical protein KIC77_05720 [Clostridiales bacterium]|nr:hypothetical protein [Clostridiales bacterium]